MMSVVAKCVLLSLPFLACMPTGASAYPTTSSITRDAEELRSALAMSQMILAQQAQLFRELINATKESQRCCTVGKSDLPQISDSAECPNPFTMVVDECFYVSPNTLSWSRARHSCRGMGGDLATPTLLYALRSFLTQNRKGPRSVWVGGSDKGPDGGGWRWLNGDPVNDAEWGKKEPNAKRAAERCLALRRDRHPVLHDEPCRSTLKFVCQYDMRVK